MTLLDELGSSLMTLPTDCVFLLSFHSMIIEAGDEKRREKVFPLMDNFFFHPWKQIYCLKLLSVKLSLKKVISLLFYCMLPMPSTQFTEKFFFQNNFFPSFMFKKKVLISDSLRSFLSYPFSLIQAFQVQK